MEVISIESKAFQEIMDTINEIKGKINEERRNHPFTETWLDNQEVCQLLRISKRTLQHYRDAGYLPFSQIGAKIYYKASDIEGFLQENYKARQ